MAAGTSIGAADGQRYTRVAITLHWVIAAAIAFNLWLGLGHDALPRNWQVMPVHKAVGITILALTLVRIGWRSTHPVPAPPRDIPVWQQRAASATHVLFYVLLLAIPLTGWAMSSGPNPRPLTWFGLVDIPYLPVSERVGGLGHDAHGVLAWAMIALIVLHVAAALRHHFGLRDDVLARMIPFFGVRADTAGRGNNSRAG